MDYSGIADKPSFPKCEDLVQPVNNVWFGLEAILDKAISNSVGDYWEKALDWAEIVQESWKAYAPHLTGNLAEAVETDFSKTPKQITVGVSVQQISRIRTLRTVKGTYVTTSGYDYTEFVNKVPPVSSNLGVGGEFIRQTWFVIAEQTAKELFG